MPSRHGALLYFCSKSQWAFRPWLPQPHFAIGFTPPFWAADFTEVFPLSHIFVANISTKPDSKHIIPGYPRSNRARPGRGGAAARGALGVGEPAAAARGPPGARGNNGSYGNYPNIEGKMDRTIVINRDLSKLKQVRPNLASESDGSAWDGSGNYLGTTYAAACRSQESQRSQQDNEPFEPYILYVCQVLMIPWVVARPTAHRYT